MEWAMPMNRKTLRIPDLTEKKKAVPSNTGLLMKSPWGSWMLRRNLWVGPGLCLRVRGSRGRSHTGFPKGLPQVPCGGSEQRESLELVAAGPARLEGWAFEGHTLILPCHFALSCRAFVVCCVYWEIKLNKVELKEGSEGRTSCRQRRQPLVPIDRNPFALRSPSFPLFPNLALDVKPELTPVLSFLSPFLVL